MCLAQQCIHHKSYLQKLPDKTGFKKTNKIYQVIPYNTVLIQDEHLEDNPYIKLCIKGRPLFGVT